MTLPRKGSRKIQVNGVSYRWLIRSKSTWNQQQVSAFFDNGDSGKVRFVVELESGSRSNLTVISEGWHKDMFKNWGRSEENIASITPLTVSKCIQSALKKGWKPSESDSFTLNLNERHNIMSKPQYLRQKTENLENNN